MAVNWPDACRGMRLPGSLVARIGERNDDGLMVASVAVLSDIHGVLPVLQAVLAEPDVRSAERIVITGDHAAGPNRSLCSTSCWHSVTGPFWYEATPTANSARWHAASASRFPTKSAGGPPNN